MCTLTWSEKTDVKTTYTVVQKFINVSLIYTKQSIPISHLTKITTANESAEYFREFYSELELLLRESFYFMALNRSNRVLAVIKLSEGGINGTICDIRMILFYLINLCASGLIICHNHPSGNLLPSETDKKLVIRLKEVCKLIEVELYDSIILTDISYCSMKSEGYL